MISASCMTYEVMSMLQCLTNKRTTVNHCKLTWIPGILTVSQMPLKYQSSH